MRTRSFFTGIFLIILNIAMGTHQLAVRWAIDHSEAAPWLGGFNYFVAFLLTVQLAHYYHKMDDAVRYAQVQINQLTAEIIGQMRDDECRRTAVNSQSYHVTKISTVREKGDEDSSSIH